jgi:endonuclease YncB( thermonuclease family)
MMNVLPDWNGFPYRFKWFSLLGGSLILISICVSVMSCQPSPVPDEDYQLASIFQLTPLTTRSPQPEPTIEMELIPAMTVTVRPSIPTEGLVENEIAYVINVIDGDTIEVFLDSETQRIRYIGIDAPEVGEDGSNLAAQLNRQLVEGKIITLEKDFTDKDQYGRLLRYVYLEDGTFVNLQLVKLGSALAVAYPPDTQYQVQIDHAQDVAQESGLGIWSVTEIPPASATPGPGTQVILDPACSQFNAPGNDNDNKNEEFVCFKNPGGLPINMTGWQLNDTYGWIYNFPEYTLEGSTTVRVRSGCGEDSKVDLFWCRDETAIWNNDGDCVYLKDRADKLQVEYCY